MSENTIMELAAFTALSFDRSPFISEAVEAWRAFVPRVCEAFGKPPKEWGITLRGDAEGLSFTWKNDHDGFTVGVTLKTTRDPLRKASVLQVQTDRGVLAPLRYDPSTKVFVDATANSEPAEIALVRFALAVLLHDGGKPNEAETVSRLSV